MSMELTRKEALLGLVAIGGAYAKQGGCSSRLRYPIATRGYAWRDDFVDALDADTEGWYLAVRALECGAWGLDRFDIDAEHGGMTTEDRAGIEAHRADFLDSWK